MVDLGGIVPYLSLVSEVEVREKRRIVGSGIGIARVAGRKSWKVGCAKLWEVERCNGKMYCGGSLFGWGRDATKIPQFTNRSYVTNGQNQRFRIPSYDVQMFRCSDVQMFTCSRRFKIYRPSV